MMPHDDMAQNAEMTKTVLQKIIDEMNGLEANRINPKHDMVEATEPTPDQETPKEDTSESDHLDPAVLSQLMDKAGTADNNGALPEDHENELPADIMVAVKKKKGLM